MYKHFNKNLPEWSIFSSHRVENIASFLLPENNCITWFYCRCSPAAKSPMLEDSRVFAKFSFEITDFLVFNEKKSFKKCVVCPRLSATIAAQKCCANPSRKVGTSFFFLFLRFYPKRPKLLKTRRAPLLVSSDLRAAPSLAVLGSFVLAYENLYFLYFPEFLPFQLFYSN